MESLRSRFSLMDTGFDPDENAWEFTVQMEGGEQGELLGYLTSSGMLSSFREVIPTANDIFIQTVQNQEVHV